MSQRAALVTGASRGIGRAIAVRLAREGLVVAVHYGSNEAAANETVATIEDSGGRAFTLGQQLGVPGDIDSLFARLDEKLESQDVPVTLQTMVNNAGIAFEDGLEGVTPEIYESQFAVNTRATLFATQAAARRMSAGGRIIAISSATTRRALPEWLVYTMTKAAINAMTPIAAQELAPRGITVNAVAAGVIDTEMNDISDSQRAAVAAIAAMGRIGEPGDVADVVAFLSSDEARWITGQVIDASGGSFL